MDAYRLKFSAPFHVDSRGNHFYEESNSFIHSDTLSSAILATWALTYPEQMQAVIKNPPYRLSSAFPFFKGCHFLPRPLSRQLIKLPDEHLKQAKKLKKIQWLDSSLWQDSLSNEHWAEQIDLETGIYQKVLASKQANLPDKLWVEEERPRLAADRISNQALDGQLFNFSRIWFHQEGGLYFLAKFSDNASQKIFETVLSVLADSGIGADRSNGNGVFSWEKKQIPGLQSATDQSAIALSLVNPTPSDCQYGWLDNSAYKLILRGGWIAATGKRKQRLRMFAEGSIFSKPLQGRMVNVSGNHSEHPVYRDARGFFINAG